MSFERAPERGHGKPRLNLRSRHPAEAVHLKRMGVKPGVPDLFLPFPVPPFHGLWIEMKSETGRASAVQKEWI